MITEESFIDFQCPYCGTGVSFPQETAGFVQACPDCTESLIVPEDGSRVGKRLPLPIDTPRLVIRRLGAGDWQDLMELTAAEELSRYTDSHPLQEEEVLRWLESDAHVKLTTPNEMFFLGIESREPAKLIGYIGMMQADLQRLQASLQIYINPAFQRQGFGLEALEAVIGFCFEGIKLHRITASCDGRNTAARRLIEKAGLRREGEFLKSHLLHGEWADTIWYAALREEYGGESGEPSEKPEDRNPKAEGSSKPEG